MRKKSRAAEAVEKAEKREKEVKELRRKIFEAIDSKSKFSEVVTTRGAVHKDVAVIDYCAGEIFASSAKKKNGFTLKLNNLAKLVP